MNDSANIYANTTQALGTLERGSSPAHVWISDRHLTAFVWHGGVAIHAYALPSWHEVDMFTSSGGLDIQKATDRIAAICAGWDAEERGEG